MGLSVILLAMLLLTAAGYYLGTRQAFAVTDGRPAQLHSLPSYHGLYVASWILIPAALLMIVWLVLEPHVAEMRLIANLPDSFSGRSLDEQDLLIGDIEARAIGGIVSGEIDPAFRAAGEAYAATLAWSRWLMVLAMALLVAGGAFAALKRISPDLRARNAVERTAMTIMIVASTIAILTTVGIILSLLFETARFFGKVPITEFLFGTQWSPQIALRADQVGSSGAFGAIPLFAGTLLITFIAMCVAVPIGLFSAIYMSEYASKRLRGTAKPILEILAGVPTVVYGFFAALTVAPFFRNTGEAIGLDVSSESALAAGIVMGIMIIPFVSSLSDDVMNAVPQSLRDGAYALGSTKAETVRQVILPAALPGIVGSVLLAISRAVGETMIVVMAAGLAANLTVNPLEAVTTVTVQIVTLLVGDQEFDSAKTLAAFALGLTLFFVTLCLNVVALHVVRKYREKYD
jgi:phosphate transport system permease protein